jgi:diguanylate cyclase (GGDEF)-like protein/PAS domain S-box-containing protein
MAEKELEKLYQELAQRTAQLSESNALLRQELVERRIAEIALRASEERFRMVADFTYDWEYWLGPDGHFIYISPSCQRITGYEASEFITDTCLLETIIHPEDRSSVTQILREELEQQKEYSIDFRIITAKGETRWIGHQCQPVYSEDESWLGLRVSNRDISDRKKADEELKARELQLRAQYKGIPIPTYTWQKVGEDIQLIDYNDAAERFTKGRIIDFIGKTTFEIDHEAPYVPSDLWLCLAEKNTFKRELFYQLRSTKENKYLAISYVFVPPDLVMVHTEDITERRMAEEALRTSEERFRATFEQAAVGIVHEALNGQFLRLNQKFCEIVGYSYDELLAKTSVELTYLEDINNDQHYKEQLLAGEIKTFSLEKRYFHKNGSIIWVNITVSLAHLPSGGFDYFIKVVEDITLRKQAEEALRQSEERFRLLATNSTDFISRHTPEGVYLYASPACRTLLGYDPEDLIGHSVYDWLHPHDLEKVKTSHAKILNSAKTQTITYRIRHRDGQYIWFEASSHTLRDVHTGEVLEIHSTSRDVTDRKQAEEALQESQRFVQKIADSTPALLYLYDLPGKYILYSNQKLLDSFGYTLEEFEAMISDAAYEQFLHPEDIARIPDIFRQFELAVNEEIIENEYRIQDRNGNWHWLYSRNTIFTRSSHGKPQQVLGIAEDITERKKSEKALQDSRHFIQRIADSSPNILYIYDLVQEEAIYANRETTTILGYTPEEIKKMGSLVLSTLVHPDDLTILHDHWNQLKAAQDGEIIEYECRLRNVNGEWHWMHSRETIFTRTQAGQPQQILGTATDITERKQTEEQLQQANEKLTRWVNELEERNQQMAQLSGINEFLQACLTVEEAYIALGSLIKPLFPGCSGGIFMIDEETKLVEAVATWGDHLLTKTLFQHDQCWALRRGRVHWVEAQDAGLFCHHLPDDQQPAASLCVPMTAQGEILGMLYLCSPKPGYLTEAKQQLARTVSEHISLSLTNLKLYETLHNQSIRDPLTGLFNRRYLEESLVRELHTAKRTQKSLGVIMIDVDHFKQFNDTFGHEAGDNILRELGSFLQKQIRASDIACRYGGEELLLILPTATLENIQQRAESLRQGIKQLQIQYRTQPLGAVTVSMGVATFPEHGSVPETLIQAADAAMYRAKKEGRDRVVMAS